MLTLCTDGSYLLTCPTCHLTAYYPSQKYLQRALENYHLYSLPIQIHTLPTHTIYKTLYFCSSTCLASFISSIN